MHNFIQLNLNSGSAQVQALLSAWQTRDGENLWQWSRLEIRLNTFRRSSISQKQFIIIIIITFEGTLYSTIFIKKTISIGQMFWFWRIKNTVSKSDFNEALIPCNELQFFDWPRIVAHSPAGLMYIAHRLVILVRRNIQVTNIRIQLRQGFECKSVEEELS